MINKIKDAVAWIYSILWLIWIPIWVCCGFSLVVLYTAMWITAAPIGLFSDRRDEFMEYNPWRLMVYIFKK